jgi:hypothetical protein
VTERPNAFALLRLADPVDQDTVRSPDSPPARQLLAEILQTPRDTPYRRHRRPDWQVAVGVALVTVLTIAATWLWLRPVTDPLGVACYAAVDLDGDRAARAGGSTLDPDDACGDYWRDRVLVNPDLVPPGSVPPLLGCVTDQGGLAVFPTDDPETCARLGLATVDPGSIDEGDTIRAVTDQLVDHFLAAGCLPLDQAERDVRQILDDNGFTDWTIIAGPPTEERPCASLAIDAPTRTITLVPMPQPPTG